LAVDLHKSGNIKMAFNQMKPKAKEVVDASPDLKLLTKSNSNYVKVGDTLKVL
jgi:hypothetical protein